MDAFERYDEDDVEAISDLVSMINQYGLESKYIDCLSRFVFAIAELAEYDPDHLTLTADTSYYGLDTESTRRITGRVSVDVEVRPYGTTREDHLKDSPLDSKDFPVMVTRGFTTEEARLRDSSELAQEIMQSGATKADCDQFVSALQFARDNRGSLDISPSFAGAAPPGRVRINFIKPV